MNSISLGIRIILTVVSGCLWSAATLSAAPQVTYAEHIASIVHSKCSSCHHPGEVGPFSLLSFEDVKSNSATIAAVIQEDFMPPWPPVDGPHRIADDRRLSPEQKSQLLGWIAAGCPSGDLTKAPAPPEYVDGWTLGPPDMVVEMMGTFEVPADGRDIYRNFVVPLNLPEKRWVKAIDLRPQARSVVHHALYFAVDSEAARARDAADPVAGFKGMSIPVQERIGGYVPGVIAQKLPEDLAYPLPAGTDLVLQAHFHPRGKVETERMTVGIYFAEAPPERPLHSIQIPPGFGRGMGINIPAGESRYVVKDSYTLPADATAYMISGHAHYVCSEMDMTAKFPDGREEVLFKVDDWNLNWQGQYVFEQPVSLPKGTKLTTTLIYDNSAENLRNPFSPPKPIRWGIESTDEMGSITMLVVAANPTDHATLDRGYRRKTLELARAITGRTDDRGRIREEIEKRFGKIDGELFQLLDRNQDGALDRSEVIGPNADRAFEWFDLDEDNFITREELEAILGPAKSAAGKSAGDSAKGAGKAMTEQQKRAEVLRQLRGVDGALFQLLDMNRDGYLSRQEIPEQFREGIPYVDSDGDGRISSAEWDAIRKAAQEAQGK